MPDGNVGRMRLVRTPFTVEVEGRQTMLRPSAVRPGPLTKSSCPPTPLNWTPLMLSAMTWPDRSTASAPLIVTMLRLRAMFSGEFTTLTGRKRTSSFPSSHSYSSGTPAANVVGEYPSNGEFLRLVTFPAR